MATKEQDNIRQEYNNATAGLNMDNAPSQIKSGALTYALNAAVENFDATGIFYSNEEGNSLCLTFPEDYILIGHHFIGEQNKHIFFLATTDSSGSEIGYMENNDCLYHTLINASCLAFNIHNPVQKVVHKITTCSTEIYWTDGLNPRRYLDVDNIPYILSYGSEFCSPTYTNQLDCNQLKIQPVFSIPLLTVVDVVSGGNLTAGVYQFTIQYSDATGNPYTSYQSITNPTPIADVSITTVNFNYPVGKSIVVDINNLDSTGQFQYFNLAVIKTINAITSVELVGTYYIDNVYKQITYTGQNVTQIRLSINDIFEKFPYYDVAQDVTAVQDVLVWDQLSALDRINYQQIANQITLQWETWRIPSTENYSNEENATNLRGYLRDEVYPFELVLLLNNGKETDGFHIPGRKKNSNENRTDVPDTNDDFIGNPDYISGGVGYSAYWKIYNTASVIGYSPQYSNDPSYKGPYQYGDFAYWESTEQYPCNEGIWGDLSEKNIRHHKFPDVLVSPVFESKLFTSSSSMVMGNDAIFPIGVKVDNNQIYSIVNSSSLTAEQKSEIVGYKIVRGDRATNKSIVAKGILRNVGKYNREGQDFYYPNYPYNDLTEDPFLNVTNNAYQQICETYTITITSLGLDPFGGLDRAIIEYTDCNTNKRTTLPPITELKTFEQCSTTKPIILSSSEGTVGIATYEIWLISNDNLVHHMTVGYVDPILGYTEIDLGQKYSAFLPNIEFVNVVIGTNGPQQVSDRVGFTSTYSSTIFATNNCHIPSVSPSIQDQYRQIFNSPETSFGQPFLGTILKLENVIYGKGEAHFTEVKNNAKYKLLTEEMQRIALRSSNDIADDPLDMTAMFTAYQAYLTIYINGITRRNYAYSFNSIADYNYYSEILNDLGIKQRTLALSRYLIPGVQAIGNATDDYPINNYQRESSVFLKTEDSLPLPTVAGVIDDSRFTISEAGNCSAPQTKEDISVVSYYASLKNNIINQWGQVYSYETIDTGYQRIFSVPSTNNTVFGGDTFICRFAFKTKLPFFIDNRVDAPDDSDIFYDEIGNVAYPKYWHSSRSILKDYMSSNGLLSNIISYKAHNFDCPNDSTAGSPIITTGTTTTFLGTTTTTTTAIDVITTGSAVTYYDGYYYLFAYGIPNFYCESSYNVDLRQAFNNKEGDFWPHVSSGIPDDWVQQTFVPIANDNTYYYNISYSKQNKENTFTHLPIDWDKPCYTYYPFRAIYSDTQNNDSDNRVNSWLTYRALSYFDFPQNYGPLTSLDGIQNRAILARFENKSLLYNNLLTIDTSNPQAAYVGNPNMFKAPPIDFAETDLGYVGSQHKFLLKIPQGQITIDAKRGQVFLVSGTQVQDISAFGSGMNRFFTDHLAFEILRYFPEIDVDNAFTSIGLHGVYDSKYDRVIITKLDYIPLYDNIIYDDQLFYQEEIVNNVVIRTRIFLTDIDYFCNKSWTLSYHMNLRSWISFHSYIPNWYIAENNFFYSGINGCCDEFDFIVGELDHTIDCSLDGEVYQISDTTTTTTTLQLGCELDGNAYETFTTTTTTTSYSTTSTTTTVYVPDCRLDGFVIDQWWNTDITTTTTSSSTTTTTTTQCIRPEGLSTGQVVYSTNCGTPWVFYQTSVVDACLAHNYFYCTEGCSLSSTIIQYSSFANGQTIYLGTGTDCTVLPDGYYWFQPNTTSALTYFTTNNSIFIITIVVGIITDIYICNSSCPPPSTTTTTTTKCYIDVVILEEFPTTTTTSTTEVVTTTTTTTVLTTTTTTTELVTTTTTSTDPNITTTTTTTDPLVTTTTSTTLVETTTTTTTAVPTTTTTTTLIPTTTTTTTLASCLFGIDNTAIVITTTTTTTIS